MDSHKNTKPSKYKSPFMMNAYTTSYETLAIHARKIMNDMDSVKTLGAISFRDNLYFEQTREVENKAIKFLNGFWSTPHHINASIKEHQTKGELGMPACLSFVDVQIGNKNYCLIAISSDAYNQEILDLMKDYIHDLPKNSKPEYVLLTGKTGNFSKLIAEVGGQEDDPKNKYKTCAEKYFVSCMTKLYGTLGNKVNVKGVVNCAFYPYDKNERYGNHEKSIDKNVVEPIGNRLTINDSGLFVTTMPCCKSCTKNKAAVLTIMKAAQDYVVGFNKTITHSPLSHSFRTHTSLSQNYYTLSDFEESDSSNESSPILPRQSSNNLSASISSQDIRSIVLSDDEEDRTDKDEIKTTFNTHKMEGSSEESTINIQNAISATKPPLKRRNPNARVAAIEKSRQEEAERRQVQKQLELEKKSKETQKKLQEKENELHDNLKSAANATVLEMKAWAGKNAAMLKRIPEAGFDKYHVKTETLVQDLFNFLLHNKDVYKQMSKFEKQELLNQIGDKAFILNFKTVGFLCCKTRYMSISFDEKIAAAKLKPYVEKYNPTSPQALSMKQ